MDDICDDPGLFPLKTTTPIKGRGALSNPQNRYQPRQVIAFDDGWEMSDDEPAPPKTSIKERSARSIITSNRSPDIPFDSSINPYQGCEHGCIYCYARPTHAYLDLSPGIDFETKIMAKSNAAQLLRARFEQPGYEVKPICIGANTDPYQPAESRLNITRSIIEVMAEFKHPFSIITKSDLIKRDLDILAPLAAQNLCSVAVSVTTLDNGLKRILEPRAPAAKTRLDTIRALSQSGINVTMLVAPIIPYINDHELESILEAGCENGATYARYILLRLPLEISEMFQAWLRAHFPDRANKVMNIIRQSRGGKDNQSQFFERMRGTGEFANMLRQRHDIRCRKLGLNPSSSSASSSSSNPQSNHQSNHQSNQAQAALKDAINRSTLTHLDDSQFRRKNEQMTLF